MSDEARRFDLVRAGPAPVGTIFRRRLPEDYDLAEIGVDLLRRGGWQFDSLIEGEVESLDGCVYELFPLSPNWEKDGDVFALSSEASSIDGSRVVCLYVHPDVASPDWTTAKHDRGANARKIKRCFSEMHHDMSPVRREPLRVRLKGRGVDLEPALRLAAAKAGKNQNLADFVREVLAADSRVKAAQLELGGACEMVGP